jgi:hypothetical protein
MGAVKWTSKCNVQRLKKEVNEKWKQKLQYTRGVDRAAGLLVEKDL